MAYYNVTTGKLKDTGEHVAMVQIKYDAAAIQAIKAIAGARWHAAIKGWSVPVAHKDALTEIAADAKARNAQAGRRSSGSRIFPGVYGYEDGERP